MGLPTDALISILCCVPASDHTLLWQTCTAIRATLKLDDYASERKIQMTQKCKNCELYHGKAECQEPWYAPTKKKSKQSIKEEKEAEEAFGELLSTFDRLTDAGVI